MIVITGPGRSGTSLLAQIYKELGFSPGGTWDEANRGGWESPEITAANQSLLRQLDVTAYGPPARYRQLSEIFGERLATSIKKRFPEKQRHNLRRSVNRIPFRNPATLSLIPFDRTGPVVDSLGPELRKLATAYEVSKDPLFSWTLPMWLEAGADVSHVLISTRDVDKALASHDASSHWQFRSSSVAKNSLLYSLGVTIWSCLDHEVPFTFVRYPDFLSDIRGLYDALVFPSETPFDKFEVAFNRVYRSALVQAYTREQPGKGKFQPDGSS